jgi:VanZ family protein
MDQSPGGRGWRILGWSLWLLLLGGCTAALLSSRAPKLGAVIVPPSLRFAAAKAVHLTAYGSLAFGVCWLTSDRRLRWAVWAGLLAHGALTEVGQLFVEGRTGSVRDVFIDAAGLALGALAGTAWASWRHSKRQT